MCCNVLFEVTTCCTRIGTYIGTYMQKAGDCGDISQIFTIYALLSQFTFCRDLRTFSAIFFGQNSLLRNITSFLHVCLGVEANIVGLNIYSKNSVSQTRLYGKSKSGATLAIML